jgi:hypothetical protein
VRLRPNQKPFSPESISVIPCSRGTRLYDVLEVFEVLICNFRVDKREAEAEPEPLFARVDKRDPLFARVDKRDPLFARVD